MKEPEGQSRFSRPKKRRINEQEGSTSPTKKRRTDMAEQERKGRFKFFRPKIKQLKNEQAGGTRLLYSTLKKKDRRAEGMKRKK